MKSVVKSPYTNEQIVAWLRGLLTIAWADGHFDPEEREFIAQLTEEDLAFETDINTLDKITPTELAETFAGNHNAAENFLRTAVMIAVADGVYSVEEALIVHEFQEALGLEIEALKSLEYTLYDPEKINSGEEDSSSSQAQAPGTSDYPHSDALQPVKKWLDQMDIDDPRLARFICKTVPSQCPFERDIKLFGHKIVHIPPMCKLNPLYEQLVGLRFRSLSYLADECEEDVSKYM
ncbi:MAG: Mo-dependent nitrogenase C-terminal domain-containing protein [Oscillatoria sp. PMC 1068.18]|nr:Mo-dependent nitrogenase C-terminal domain-containing protein [Oscillatoria sp. PMC 1076.18]MEC4991053.1 Mo-dependent nitrogenase C-terminal domain-containing protein [Oscillatoria sp. PMC 1068.18]